MNTFPYKDRVRFCYARDLHIEDVFDVITAKTIANISSATCVPAEFVIPPFITGLSHFLNKSEIRPWGTWSQPAIIYCSTVGFTGTNKTAAMDVIRTAISNVENAQGMAEQASRLNQCKCSNILELFEKP